MANKEEIMIKLERERLDKETLISLLLSSTSKIDAYKNKLEQSQQEYERLLEMFKTQQANTFGKKSEKTNIGQMSLFNEVEMTADEQVKEESFTKEEKPNHRKGAKKKPSLNQYWKT
jgi:hypothetical protein